MVETYRQPGEVSRPDVHYWYCRRVTTGGDRGEGQETIERALDEAQVQLDALVGAGVPWHSIKVSCSEEHTLDQVMATVCIFWLEG